MTKLSHTDLQKGVDALKAAAQKNNPKARAAELFQKAQDGSANAEELEELRKSLDGGSFAQDVTAGLRTDTIQKSIDVSDFLRESNAGIVDGLTQVADALTKSQADDHGFRIALATTVASMADTISAQGEILKSMAAKIGVVMEQPARGPKSQGVRAEPMAKSFAGQRPAPGQGRASEPVELTKSQILDAMDEMHLQKGVTNIGGEDLLKAISKYESTNFINPTVMQAVEQHVASKKSAA